MRRLLPLAIALGVGLLALLWGLAALEGIVIDERAQARAGIEEQRATLAEYARRTLELRLQARILEHGEDYERALVDPMFQPNEPLLLVVDDQQRLPRLPDAAPGLDTPAWDLVQRIRQRQLPPGLELGSPSMRRAELGLEMLDAIDRGERGEIEGSMRDILRHRASFVLDSTYDLPLTLALLDELVAFGPPAPTLMKGLLRDGFDAGPGARLQPLQRTLLARRSRFTAPDFELLAARIVALSQGAGVPTEDFERAAHPPASAPVPRPSSIDGPMLLGGGAWALVPYSPSQQRGIAVDLAELEESLADEMRRRGLLLDEDRFALPPPIGATALATLLVEIDAPRLRRAWDEAEERFWLKTGFVAAAASLALAIVVLSLMLQRRRHRFVELKSDFVATVSHELRTPLASIRLMAETLQRRTRDLPAARDYPARIVRDIDGLAFLVENILSFNRLDKGRWQPRRGEVSLEPLVDEVLEDLESHVSAEIRLESEGLRGVVLHADRELLKLLLRNLLKNACTYNERDPIELELVGRREGPRFVIEVADNGVGIPAAEQPRVFDDFRRGTGTRARGSGLGLSICRKTMEAHGGRIRIASSGPQGTRFTLEFPATMVETSP
ncbi:MAG: HAMP domain-containing histidine kinase [Myxococcales bacterium]|nr:HAMP domain-containing histidine kinase [Myxococcales bacterium]MCB9719020.1 HAMP domain-containing histidine kinase [Myxococcales bacterium]